MPNASAFGPPVLTFGVELLFQTPRGPRLEIASYLLRTCLAGRDDNVDMIRPTIDGMEFPSTVPARFRDLPFNSVPLLLAQAACVLGHFRRRLDLSHGVW